MLKTRKMGEVKTSKNKARTQSRQRLKISDPFLLETSW
ncbi:hypothetical protein SORDD16_01217 [Streptococcus oralis]|uniref:Uncharacterized protein n=1 Tax=Streptococcus oralis TaxID=1303 RepID=A0A139PCR9_STROR|nr:hypothetical protein SORDD16_01217 [Streptococcus oralis]